MAAKKQEQAVAENAPPIDFSGYAGQGFETVSASDVGIPFLVILQKGTPEADDAHPDYIQGAKPGMIMNNVSKELFQGRDEGILFVPCAFKKYNVEWKPRDSGGGLVAMHVEDDILSKTRPNDKGQSQLPNGNLVVPTAYYFGEHLTKDGRFQKVIVSMSSTQLKKSRQWLYQMGNMKMKGNDGKEFVPPMCAHVFKLSTVPEQKDQYTWYGWKIELAKTVADPALFHDALEFSASVQKEVPRIGAQRLDAAEELPV